MADVTIDGTISTSTARGMRSVVFTDANTGYQFFIDSTSDFSYRKTTDGGATWGAAVVIMSGTHVAFDVWFDKWTPSDSGTLIHMVWFGTVTDDVNYQTLDTATDTLGTARVIFNGATSVAGRGVFCSVTKTRSGYLYCAYDIDAGAEKGFHRSTDGGTTWSANLATTFIEATIDQCLLFPATGTGDDNDCFALYQDASTNALTLKTWDSSAAAQTESATIATQGESTTDLTGQYGFAASVRHSDGHILAAVRTAGLGAAGAFEFYDIASTSSWTKKTNLGSGIDDNWYPQVFIDQTTDEIYVAYNGKRDGTEAIGAASKIWYSKSSDGGTTWDAEHAYMEGAAGAVVQCWAPLMGSRFYVSWRVGSTLVGNAVNSLTFSSGSTFNDSVTESVTASEIETVTAGFVGARTESGSAADSQAATASMGVARSESLAASDSEAGNRISPVAASESLTASDSETGGVGFSVARTESGSASDSETGNATYLVAETESLAAADSETGTTTTGPQTFNVSASDSLAASDSEVGPATYPVSRAESGSVADSASSTAFFAALLEEMLATGDMPEATADLLANRAELLAALDDQTGVIAPTGAAFTFSIEGGPIMTLSIVAGRVLESSVRGGSVLSGTVDGAPV